MPGDFNLIRNHKLFEQVLTGVQRENAMDPKAAFASAMPGFLGNVTENIGPWAGREEMRFEIPGVAEDALAVDFHERAKLGDTSMFHVVAEPGLLLAGRTQQVSPNDFRHGMSMDQAVERANRPQIDYNQKVAKSLLDVLTSGGATAGSLTEAFAWSANDGLGNSVSQPLAAENGNQVAAVLAHSSQTVEWPLRNGSAAAAGHDHVASSAGAWTEAIAATQRDTILEHPGAGRVQAYVGATVAAAVRAAIKTEYGAIDPRVPFVLEAPVRVDGFGSADALGTIGSVDYVFSPDMDTNQALYVAANRKPFYASTGASGYSQSGDGVGAWSESGDPETAGVRYGFRQYTALGVKEPVMAVICDHVA